jgi:hypothetical protein
LDQTAAIGPLGHFTCTLGVPFAINARSYFNAPRPKRRGILELIDAMHKFRDNCEEVLDAITLHRQPNKDEAWVIQFYCRLLLAEIESSLPQQFSKG